MPPVLRTAIHTLPAVTTIPRLAVAAASENKDDGEMAMEEANCPCSDMGSGTGLGQAGPLTELCDVGDVVVVVLPGA